MTGRLKNFTLAITLGFSGFMIAILGIVAFAWGVSENSTDFSLVGVALSIPLVVMGLAWIIVFPHAILNDDHVELGESR